MRGRWNSIFVCAVFVAAGSMAQQTNTSVDTPGGTAGSIPEFWGPSTIGKSVMTQNQQRIGIGTKNVTFYDPLIVQSNSGSGGGIGMIGMALPGASDYAWAESDYLLNNPANTTGPVNLWGVGAEGLFSAQGQVSNQDMYIVNAISHRYNFAIDAADNVYIGGSGFLSSAATLAMPTPATRARDRWLI